MRAQVKVQVKVERDAAHAERDAAITKFNEVRAAWLGRKSG